MKKSILSTAMKNRLFKANSELENLLNAEFDWAEFMSVTLTLMKTCDKVYLLPGWKNSKGCCWEVKEAKRIGMPIWYAEK